MPSPPDLSPQTRSAIATLPWRQTPNYARKLLYPWRPWHMEQFGGSPIPVRSAPDQPFSHTRLYLGPSRAELGDARHPTVDGIVNLCNLDDPWELCEADRRWPRGEGMFGYTWPALDRDAREVAELVREGQRMLIHCMAGVNRSATLTCAVLMHLEGISANDALCRVQRFHPLAAPEDGHWLALRQLDVALRAERGEFPVA